MLNNNPLLLKLREELKQESPTQASGKKDHLQGTVKGTQFAYGFVQSKKGSFFLPPGEMSKCLHGDTIEFTITSNSNQREEARVLSIVDSRVHEFLGVIKIHGQHPYIHPLSSQIKQRFFIPRLKRNEENDRDIVRAKMIQHPLETGSATAEPMYVVCSERDLLRDWKIACDRHSVVMTTPEKPLMPHAQINDPVLLDLNHLPFFTIDGESTRDMDDALYLERVENNQIRLIVAIADPDHFLSPGDPIDLNAKAAGFTTYLPGMTLSMLPESIAEHRASLVQGESRRTVCCEMLIDPAGTITYSAFFTAVIRSSERLSYDQVKGFTQGIKTGIADQTGSLLDILVDLTARRHQWRRRDALPNGDYVSYQMILSNQSLVRVERLEQSLANQMVEECMVAANLCFAQYMHQNRLPCVYRRNDGFKPNYLNEIAQRLATYGIMCDTDQMSELPYFLSIMRQVNALDNPDVQIMLRQYLTRGDHSLEYGPHMSMGVEGYATFTSPIRKYSDLLNHRSIKRHLNKQPHLEGIDADLIEHINKRARDTEGATREVKNSLLARYYQLNLETTLPAKVMRLTTEGIGVEIIDTGAWAFIHRTHMGQKIDRYSISDDGLALLKNDECLFKLGETINVTVKSCNLAERTIGLVPY